MSRIYRYSAEEAARLRQQLLDEQIVPALRDEMKRTPKIKSALMQVAQYWCDEANDAVHGHLILSSEARPDPSKATYEGKGKHWSMSLYSLGTRGWDDNNEAIALFAAFTTEGAHQEMMDGEAYSPYALFTRDGDGVRTELVGKMVRPWLDGVRPEWDEEYRDQDGNERDDDSEAERPAAISITDLVYDNTNTVEPLSPIDPPSGQRPLVMRVSAADFSVDLLELTSSQRPVSVRVDAARYVGLLRQWPDDGGGDATRVMLELRSPHELRADFVRCQKACDPKRPAGQAALVRIDAELEKLPER
jgi:hypothetical protein